MAEDKFHSIAIPILEELAAVETIRDHNVIPKDLAEAIGRSADEVEVELKRLAAGGFFMGQDTSSFAGYSLMNVQLTEKGARAAGVWPTADPYDALLTLLDERLLDPDLDDEEKSNLRAFRDSLIAVGRTAAGSVLAGYVKTRLGL